MHRRSTVAARFRRRWRHVASGLAKRGRERRWRRPPCPIDLPIAVRTTDRCVDSSLLHHIHSEAPEPIVTIDMLPNGVIEAKSDVRDSAAQALHIDPNAHQLRLASSLKQIRQRVQELPGVDQARFHRLVRACRCSHGLEFAHSGPITIEHAKSMIALAASGVPVVTDGSFSALPAHIATTLSELQPVAHWRPSSIADRQVQALRLRRLVLSRHGPLATWANISRQLQVPAPSEPSVSVLLASRRPRDVVAAVQMVANQRLTNCELVVGLHGDEFGPALEDAVRRASPEHATILRIPASVTLGVTLNRLADVASGSIVTKWDDDDWYGVDHLSDLVEEMRNTGATVVGKAAEFVYLESDDKVIRRSFTGCHAYSRNIAGGTMMILREDLRAVGGFRDEPRFVDRLLLNDIVAAGGAPYRSHGFQYVLRRRPTGHTWAASDAKFLEEMVDSRAGCDLGFADIRSASTDEAAA